MADAEALATLTVEDVCEILRVSRWTIYSYVKHGQLRAVRVGPRKLRFLPSDMAAYLEGRATTTAAPEKQAARPSAPGAP